MTRATQRPAAAIPNAQTRVLEGDGHFAHRTDLAMLASIVEQFLAA